MNIWKYNQINQTNLIVNLYSKKYLKAEKRNEHKRRLSMFICTNNID